MFVSTCFVLLTCFHHNHFLLHSTHALMSRLQLWNLIGENPPGVLSEVATCRYAPLNQCDTKSSSDGISMIIATTLFMYQLDYNKLKLSHTNLLYLYYLNFVIICGPGFMCVYIYYSPHTIQVHFISFIHCSLIFPFDPVLGHDFLHVYKIIS